MINNMGHKVLWVFHRRSQNFTNIHGTVDALKSHDFAFMAIFMDLSTFHEQIIGDSCIVILWRVFLG